MLKKLASLLVLAGLIMAPAVAFAQDEDPARHDTDTVLWGDVADDEFAAYYPYVARVNDDGVTELVPGFCVILRDRGPEYRPILGCELVVFSR